MCSFNDDIQMQTVPMSCRLGAPPGSNVCCNDRGWMTKELFVKWLKHFHLSVKCTKEDRVLQILDGHVSHSKKLEAIIFAIEPGIVSIFMTHFQSS